MIANNTVSLFRREDHEQEKMILAVMPKTGVVEYDDLIVRQKLNGWVWRDGKRVLAAKKGGSK